jgi:hypothetical protein
MVSLPLAVQSVLLSFAPLFSKRVFEHARLLMVSWPSWPLANEP